ncbi:MAG: fumarylacetoacetate hydrolase family protein [Propionibacteriaceae bacterium]|nr:fumarylacetoacetate hydrolase family protein [Propionibacteriaceae bacterium]
MRLVTFEHQGRQSVGVLVDDQVVEIGDGRQSMLDVIEAGESAISDIKAILQSAALRISVTEVTLMAPIPKPIRNILCVGRNYAEHVIEGNRNHDRPDEMPPTPTWFTKATTSVCGPYDDLLLTATVSQKFDWEAELAIVIGTEGRNIAEQEAMNYVHSLAVFNDVSARDIQHSYADQWFKGKSADRSSPFGPWLTVLDDSIDPTNLDITCRVNGITKQQSNTSLMMFDIPFLICDISRVMTLLPGDIISTGTPSGVGSGRTPREFLKDGDVLETEVETLGTLRNVCRTT